MGVADGVSRGRLVWSLAVMLLIGIMAGSAHAQIIDRIEINQAGDQAEIQIRFTTRIQYLRQASLKNGDVRVYFKILEKDARDPRPEFESKDSPPSDIAPHFTVTYPELDSSLAISFGKVVKYRVRPGKDGRSISIFTPLVEAESESDSAPSAMPAVPAEVEREAKQLIASAREALGQGDAAAAIATLNRLLNLPPNQQSQAAQKLIGEAREKNREFAKARVEYQLYLKLYPDAADAGRVRERLSRLPVQDRQAPAAPAARKQAPVDDRMKIYGSFSQTYYKGELHTDATTVGSPLVSSFTSIDQKQLVSMLDLNGRKRTETTDTRIVFRDSHSADFLPGKPDKNRLNAAYIEQSAREPGYLYRLGRQSGTSGGVLGRFDGAWLGYGFNSTWRVNAVAGTPVEFYGSSVEKKAFAGMSVDLTRLPEQWSGSGYFIQQRVGGVIDRRAVGMEARYFDPQRNYTGVLDYDTLFKAVNIAMFQGNWITESGDSYNLLLDHRKSPSLQITNALLGQTVQSIESQIQSGVSEQKLRADAKALSASANLFLIGMTHPYSPRLKLGGDFRITNISGTGASGMLPAAAGTGNTYMLSVQAIGNSLLLKNDLGVASASYIDARTYKAQSLAFTQVEVFRQKWRLDVALQLYAQQDNQGVDQRRVTPSLKLGYRMNESMSFEGEAGVENTRTSSAMQDDRSRRKYFFVGYRWDFH